MKDLEINDFLLSYTLDILIQILHAHPRKYLCFCSINQKYVLPNKGVNFFLDSSVHFCAAVQVISMFFNASSDLMVGRHFFLADCQTVIAGRGR